MEEIEKLTAENESLRSRLQGQKELFDLMAKKYILLSENNLTKREVYIKAAMQGLLANKRSSKDLTPWYNKIFQFFNPKINRPYGIADTPDLIKIAIQFADELMKQVN